MEDEVIWRSAERCLIWRSVLGGRMFKSCPLLPTTGAVVVTLTTLLRFEPGCCCLAGDWLPPGELNSESIEVAFLRLPLPTFEAVALLFLTGQVVFSATLFVLLTVCRVVPNSDLDGRADLTAAEWERNAGTVSTTGAPDESLEPSLLLPLLSPMVWSPRVKER